MPGTTANLRSIAEAGVVGAGGAGFPTHVKLSGRAAVRSGRQKADESVIDHMIITNAHDSLFPALGQSVVLKPKDADALGVIESFNVRSASALTALMEANAHALQK